jgi:hypothetical protein
MENGKWQMDGEEVRDLFLPFAIYHFTFSMLSEA